MLTKTFDFIKVRLSETTSISWTNFLLALSIEEVALLLQVMCIQYLPNAKVKSENYGDLNISILREEELANFHIRTVRLVHKQNTVR